jgi:TonB family protein
MNCRSRKTMSKRTNLISLAAMFVLTTSLTGSAQSFGFRSHANVLINAVSETDRDRDGLMGPVRRIRTETTKLSNKGGKPTEGQRQVLETAAYDIKGGKIENAYFPISSATLTGREVYKYDDKGNISEMTLFNADGSLLSKEIYTYEYDNVGNWTKMTTSVAVVEGGKIIFEPTEVTYRTISYYLDENLAKMVLAAGAPSTAPAQVPASSPATGAVSNPVALNPAPANATPSPAQANKTAAVIPASGGIASLSKNSVGSPVNSSSIPGGTGAGNQSVVMDGEPPAKAAPKPLMKPISGGVLNGRALELPAPEYPDIARRMRTVGLISVEVIIDSNGKVISAKAGPGSSVLQQAAVKAAYRARFSPTTLSGQPVKVSGVINYNFSLGK